MLSFSNRLEIHCSPILIYLLQFHKEVPCMYLTEVVCSFYLSSVWAV